MNTERLAPAIAAAAALAAFATGIALGTYVAGGSDSSCYLNAGRLLAQGTTRLEQPLARIAPWRDAGWTFTPAGFIPSPVDPASLVPMCPPGLPLAMAVFQVLHLSTFLVVPLLGALTVWLTYIVGRRFDRPLTGAAAAALMACSPIFLYQIVQPMTDVPAAAWWLLAVALALGVDDEAQHPLLAGLAASMALLTRPNLLPLAAIVAIHLAVTRRSGRRLAGVATFAFGLLPGAIVLAVIQRAMYGSALATGYGAARNLFASAHVIPNLRRYPAWLVQAHTPFLLLALAAPAVLRRPAYAWVGLALAGVTLVCYLPYVVFDDWWYIRFLLPAVPVLVMLSVIVLAALLERIAPRAHVALTVACVAVLMAWWIQTAGSGRAFALADLEDHYYEAGTFVAERLPPRAAVVTVRNSGSVQYYAGRPTVLWDMLDPASLDPAVKFLGDQGYAPYLLLESDEEPAFRARFGAASVLGGLDWPPIAQIGRTIRVYDPRDRARFLADGQRRTEYIWVTGRHSRSPTPRR